MDEQIDLLAICDDEIKFPQANADGEQNVKIAEPISVDAEFENGIGINKFIAIISNLKKICCNGVGKLSLVQLSRPQTKMDWIRIIGIIGAIISLALLICTCLANRVEGKYDKIYSKTY